MTADFLRYYGVSLREAITRWPAQDFTDAVENLPPSSATARAELGDLWDWGHLAANVADLVDLMSFWLQSEYTRWIYDPDDPEAKAAERERKRRRLKPPSSPLIVPVAHRPPSVAESYHERYLQRMAELAPTGPVKEIVSSDDWDRELGI